MTCPCPIHLLIQVASYLKTLFIGLLIACRVGGGGVVLFSTIGSTHQVQYGIVTFAQLIGTGITLASNLFPHLWCDIRRDVKRTTVAHYKGRLCTSFCKPHKRVFQCQLCLQDSQFTLVVEVAISCQIAPAALTIHRGNFGHGKHLKAQIREVFDDAHQCGSLTSTRATRQYNSLYITHNNREYLLQNYK